MMRIWERSLAGQFIVFLLLALLLAQGLTMLITRGDQRRAVREFYDNELISRASTLANVLSGTPDRFRADIAHASSTTLSRFWVSPVVPAEAAAWGGEAIERIEQPLSDSSIGDEPPHGRLAGHGVAESIGAETALANMDTAAPRFPDHTRWYRFSDSNGLGVAIPLGDGSWLNAAYYKAFPSEFWKPQTLLSLGITAATLCLLGIVAARRIARPLRQLASFADALGRGESLPLPEYGPEDIRRTSIAFNRMQSRLLRFVEDRTRMLAAISHDFRTPLTSLRLRAEHITDEGVKGKILETIAEMQAMTEATLTFAKEEATAEQTRAADLCSLVESLCDDLIELGQDVVFIGGERTVYRCRPDALRRAIRNLIENAVRYGGHARVSLVHDERGIEIRIADEGPGIPDNLHEYVFSPFSRLERSRNRQTGGVGLGMSIARAIARHHGGDVVLRANNPGLVAVVMLPEQAGFGPALPDDTASEAGRLVSPQARAAVAMASQPEALTRR